MLTNLHVKNLALIEEVEVDFREGLNIMTGETGAGKSIIIGSVNIALGGKVSKDMIRNGADYALVELIFQTENKKIEDFFHAHDLNWEDGQVIISRKIMGGKNIAKINGETVSLSMLREIASELMDIHGQHDNESLLKEARHLQLLDEYGGADVRAKKEELAGLYHAYREEKKKLEGFMEDEEARRREMSFLSFVIHEIEETAPKEREDELLEEEYRYMENGEKIVQGLAQAHHELEEADRGIRDRIGAMVHELGEIREMDERIGAFYETVADMESLATDLAREISSYLDDDIFDEERHQYLEKRLDELNRLKAKYGHSLEAVMQQKAEAEQKLSFYENYEEERKKAQESLEQLEQKLKEKCAELTGMRKKAGEEIKEKLTAALKDLNFLEVVFDIRYETIQQYTANGNDSVSFLISTNPGEALKPLAKIASGGELSRIMLGMKSVLAGKDRVETLIFDEIDTGISGRTAQMVSQKLKEISREHQVICITHLPQIAAMARHHYLIEKMVKEGKTQTQIERMPEEKSVEELARMLGGAQITETVLESAREMKRLAKTLE